MNYSGNPGHVRALFFKPGSKWYMDEVLDMSNDYTTEYTPIHAVVSAFMRHDPERGLRLLNQFIVVVPDPFHTLAYPVMIKPESVDSIVAELKQMS